jgi:trehalose 6-phosphate phosphatase
VADWLDRAVQGHPGVLVERKRHGTALHYRQAPQESDWCLDVAADLARRHGLDLQPGKMMIELRTPGWDKGSAVGHILTLPGFAETTRWWWATT